MHIRGCGAKSYAEIMEKLFLWNLANIPDDKQIDYLMEVVEKNKKTGESISKQ